MNQGSPVLTRLANDATPEQALLRLQRDGAEILDDVLGANRVARIVSELEPDARVGDACSGARTMHTGGLLVKSDALRCTSSWCPTASSGIGSASATTAPGNHGMFVEPESTLSIGEDS